MRGPFARDEREIVVRLGDLERTALAALPEMLDRGGDAGGRLTYVAHPDDEAADRRYRDLVGASLEEARQQDRSVFLSGLGRERIDADEAEAWLRVIGEARLLLAHALGVEDDGWEDESQPAEDAEMALLLYLGHLQDRLVEVLG